VVAPGTVKRCTTISPFASHDGRTTSTNGYTAPPQRLSQQSQPMTAIQVRVVLHVEVAKVLNLKPLKPWCDIHVRRIGSLPCWLL
jgi:hypothetical protein